MDFSLCTVSELNVAVPPLQVSDNREVPAGLFAGHGI